MGKNDGTGPGPGQAPGEAEAYVLRLYVAGMTPRSMHAVQALREFCDKHLAGRYEIEVVDIYQHPEKAREEKLVAAPTLIKKLPLPLARFIGDLSKEGVLLKGLGLKTKSGE
jgi:circadian clock protein KaiB